MKIDGAKPVLLRQGRVELARIDATTELETDEHQAADEKDAMLDAEKFAQ